MRVGILGATANQVTDFYLGNQVIRHCDVPIILMRRARSQGRLRLARKVANTMVREGARAVVSLTRDWSFERRRQKRIRQYLEDRFAELGEKASYDSGPRVLEVDDIHDRRSLQALRDAGVTVLFQNGAGIVRSPLMAVARGGIVNVHHGYLPNIRGCQSMAWGLLEDHPEWIGVSVHLIDAGIDTGPILKRRHLTVVPGDTYPRLFVRATLLGGRLLVEAIRELARGAAETIPRTSPGVYRSAMARRDWLALSRRMAVDHAEH